MAGKRKLTLSGAAAGLVNGLFGGGGGMVLLPLLRRGGMEEKQAFATCVAVIFPICSLSAIVYLFRDGLDLPDDVLARTQRADRLIQSVQTGADEGLVHGG